MYGRKRTPTGRLIALVCLIAVLAYIGYLLAHRGSKMRESLSTSSVATSNQMLKDDLTRASGDDAIAQRTATTDATASDQIASWAIAQQATAAALQHLGTDLHTRLDAEKHLGTTGDKLHLQLSDMENKVIAARTTASSLDEVTSAQANLDSAVSDGQMLVDTLSDLKK